MQESEIKYSLQQKLTPKRYKHSLGVSETAGMLAERFGAAADQARLAGLLHDCARDFSDEELLQAALRLGFDVTVLERHMPVLLHAPLGAVIAQKQYQVSDAAVCQAICLHTTGGPGMTMLDKILYLADVIEPGRNFSGVDTLRQMAEQDLEKAVLAALDQSILYMVHKAGAIHPDTILARNEILLRNSV